MMLADHKIADGNFLPPGIGRPVPGCDRDALRISIGKGRKIECRGGSRVQEERKFHSTNTDLDHGQAIAGRQRNFFCETFPERPGQQKHEDETVSHGQLGREV